MKRIFFVFLSCLVFFKAQATLYDINHVRVSYQVENAWAYNALEVKHRVFTHVEGQEKASFYSEIKMANVGSQERFPDLAVPNMNAFFLNSDEIKENAHKKVKFYITRLGDDGKDQIIADVEVPMMQDGKGLMSILLKLGYDQQTKKITVEPQAFYVPFVIAGHRRIIKREGEGIEPIIMVENLSAFAAQPVPVISSQIIHPMHYFRASYVVKDQEGQTLLNDGKHRVLYAEPMRMKKNGWKKSGELINLGEITLAEAGLNVRNALSEQGLECFKALKERVASDKLDDLKKRGLRFFVRTFDGFLLARSEGSFVDVALHETKFQDNALNIVPFIEGEKALLSLRLEISAQGMKPLFGYIPVVSVGGAYQKQESR